MALPEMPTPEMIDVNGVTLEVFRAGKGRPVVLCHGWPELAWSWRYQITPLVEAGYEVIVPNQRGYGRSSRPEEVTDYDMEHLTGDLAALLDHFGHEDALFVGHDWGAIVTWGMTLMHPERMAGVVNLSVPFMERGPTPWVEFWEKMLGPDFYIVHFNRQPGVAAKVFEENTEQFLRNMYRTAMPQNLGEGMPFINLTHLDEPPGKAIMSDEELAVFVDAFRESGFASGINWYRNFDRNWEHLGAYEQIFRKPALMIYGEYDSVPQNDRLEKYVPDVEIVTLKCGHWIQQELPEDTNRLMLDWLSRHYPS